MFTYFYRKFSVSEVHWQFRVESDPTLKQNDKAVFHANNLELKMEQSQNSTMFSPDADQEILELTYADEILRSITAGFDDDDDDFDEDDYLFDDDHDDDSSDDDDDDDDLSDDDDDDDDDTDDWDDDDDEDDWDGDDDEW